MNIELKTAKFEKEIHIGKEDISNIFSIDNGKVLIEFYHCEGDCTVTFGGKFSLVGIDYDTNIETTLSTVVLFRKIIEVCREYANLNNQRIDYVSHGEDLYSLYERALKKFQFIIEEGDNWLIIPENKEAA